MDHGKEACLPPCPEPQDYEELSALLEEIGELPDIVDGNTVLLFPVDPHRLFSCWTIRKSDIMIMTSKTSRKYRRLNPVLRLYDITGVVFDGTNAAGRIDIGIDISSDSCYISVGPTGRRLMADLGFVNEYGIFYPFCRSNIVETPPGPEAPVAAWPEPARVHSTGSTEAEDPAFKPGISSHTFTRDK
jgi:hypothetical protein